MSGFVLIHRRVYDNPVFADFAESSAFVWMIIQAQWRTKKVRYKDRIIELERGQLALSTRDLARKMGWSQSRAQRFTSRLTDAAMIGSHSGSGVNVITICNYNKYQIDPDVGGSPSGSPSVHQAVHARFTSGSQNKEDNKTNKINHDDTRAEFNQKVIDAAGLHITACFPDLHLVSNWLNSGLEENFILGEIGRIRSNKLASGEDPPNSLRYFDKCLTTPKVVRTRQTNQQMIDAL